MEISIPYGKQKLYYKNERICQILTGRTEELKPDREEDEIVLQAMEKPYGGKRLEELAAGKQSAVILISDHTRPVPSRHIIPHMLSALRKGNPEIGITLLVATGCHRGTQKEELIHKLGRGIVDNERIIVHDCEQMEMMADLGELPSGAGLWVNRLAVECDLLLAEGFIEPHFFAGFSGGRKSVLPGVCGKKTVLGNHCSEFIDSPWARAGVLEGNPIHRDMDAAMRMAGLAYIVNVIIDGRHRVAAAFAGEPGQAHEEGCRRLMEYCRAIPVRGRRAGIVITSNGGYPLDQNVYQTVKGLSTAEAASEAGTVFIMCSECGDGIGGDQFYQALKQCESPSALLAKIRRTPMDETVPDQWQYQILARILEKHPVVFVTRPRLRSAVEDMKMIYAGSIAEAVRKADERLGEERAILAIPDGVSVVVAEG